MPQFPVPELARLAVLLVLTVCVRACRVVARWPQPADVPGGLRGRHVVQEPNHARPDRRSAWSKAPDQVRAMGTVLSS
jgi:hypothetical protein